MSYEHIKYSRNFKNLPYGPYDEITSVGGKTIIKYLVPTSKANLEDLNFETLVNYYWDGNFDPADDIRVKYFDALSSTQSQTVDLQPRPKSDYLNL